MRSYALYNAKGGVGKTASAVNLSYLAARDGKSTLLWDLDPQGSASFYYKVKPRIKGGAKKLVSGKGDLSKAIKSTDYDHLDLLPADESSRNLDLILDDLKKSKDRLRDVMEQVAEDYDYVFIDCPPGISLITENIFRAVKTLLVPLIPTFLSLRTYDQVTKFFEEEKRKKLSIIPFFSMVDRRKRVHKEVLAEYGEKKAFLTAYVPYASDVERMGERRRPLPAFAPRSKASTMLEQVWEEIKSLS